MALKDLAAKRKPAPQSRSAPATDVGTNVVNELVAERQRASNFEKELAKRDALLEEASSALKKLTDAHTQTQRERDDIAKAKREDQIVTAIKFAAQKHGAVDPEDVVALVTRRFAMVDDGKGGSQIVADDEGKSDPDAFVKAYLTAKPHLAGPKVATGSGAPPVPGRPPSPPPPLPGGRDIRTGEGATASLHERLLQLVS